MTRNPAGLRDVPALCLGVVPYLNVQPLIYDLETAYPQLRLVSAPPRELDRALSDGRIDLGIAPILAAFARPDHGVLPATAIACDGPVHSVVIASRQPLADLRRVYRDPDSLTSNALAAILSERCWGGRIEWVDLPDPAPNGPEELPEATGALLIGDRAMRERARYGEIVDLGAAWKEWTGLPFVFAAWVGRANLDTGGLTEALVSVHESNAKRLDEIATAYDGLPDISIEQRARYLRENLTYRIGPRERQAIKRFGEELRRSDLIPSDREVRWIEDG